MPWQPDMMIYHANCADGFGAAWAAWLKWGDAVEYVPCSYGQQPPDVTGKRVLIGDFSFKRDVIERMGNAAASIVILDHHETAEAELSDWRRFKDKPRRFTIPVVEAMNADLRRNEYRPVCALFDMSRSGARMVWDFCFPGSDAPMLIKLIEDYELYRFDNKNYRKGVTRSQREENINREVAQANWTHQPYKTHGLVYVIAVNGDTFAGIAREFGFKESDLLKFNEVPEGFPLSEGDIVYFQKKKARADKPYFEHVVQIGESMYSISQKYGIQLRNLYRLNKKSYEYVPEEGDVLRLR